MQTDTPSPIPSSHPSLSSIEYVQALEPLGKGSSRKVYELPGTRLVLKVALGPWSYGCNLDERDNYLTAVEAGLDHAFAKVEACAEDGAWLIMERCHVADDDHGKPVDWGTMCSFVREIGECCGDLWVSDALPFNMGWRLDANGRSTDELVFIDYPY